MILGETCNNVLQVKSIARCFFAVQQSM